MYLFILYEWASANHSIYFLEFYFLSRLLKKPSTKCSLKLDPGFLVQAENSGSQHMKTNVNPLGSNLITNGVRNWVGFRAGVICSLMTSWVTVNFLNTNLQSILLEKRSKWLLDVIKSDIIQKLKSSCPLIGRHVLLIFVIMSSYWSTSPYRFYRI